MATIRMVSHEEGERLRKEEDERQARIKALLVGATIIDVKFSGCGITDHTIQEVALQKDGQRLSITVEAELFYECIQSRLVVTDEDRGTELK